MINISSKTPTTHEISLLNRRLSFVPKYTIFDAKWDFLKFSRCLRFQEYFKATDDVKPAASINMESEPRDIDAIYKKRKYASYHNFNPIQSLNMKL